MTMKLIRILILSITGSIVMVSCSSSKTYFTPQVRVKIENAGVDLNKIQFYVDRNIELKREISKEDAKVSKGDVKIEDGKYIDIISLKKNTPGICSGNYPDKILVSFEQGDNKFLTFGKTRNASVIDPYKLLAFEWFDNGDGRIQYEGKSYRITDGTQGSVMIKSKFVRKADQIKERKMEGNKVTDN